LFPWHDYCTRKEGKEGESLREGESWYIQCACTCARAADACAHYVSFLRGRLRGSRCKSCIECVSVSLCLSVSVSLSLCVSARRVADASGQVWRLFPSSWACPWLLSPKPKTGLKHAAGNLDGDRVLAHSYQPGHEVLFIVRGQRHRVFDLGIYVHIYTGIYELKGIDLGIYIGIYK